MKRIHSFEFFFAVGFPLFRFLEEIRNTYFMFLLHDQYDILFYESIRLDWISPLVIKCLSYVFALLLTIIEICRFFSFTFFHFRIHDACKLLVLPLGNALLLTETIKNDLKTKSNSKQALTEIGVVNISNLMALDILERRNDICSYWFHYKTVKHLAHAVIIPFVLIMPSSNVTRLSFCTVTNFYAKKKKWMLNKLFEKWISSDGFFCCLFWCLRRRQFEKEFRLFLLCIPFFFLQRIFFLLCHISHLSVISSLSTAL